MPTTREWLEIGVARLRDAGSASARLDAELLLAYANGVDRTAILAHPEAPVGTGPAQTYEALLDRRAAGEPVAYIRGMKEFHGLAFSVDARALIPRPETELLVDLGLAEVMHRLTGSARAIGGPAIEVVDIGTGSGAIAVALAVALRDRRVPPEEVAILALDVSPDALDLARENAVGHAVGDRLAFREADLVPDDLPPVDLVLANLPYVDHATLPTLPVAASFEPALALDGGPDGLAVIARLVDRLDTLLAVGGVALLEIGADQGDGVTDLVAERRPGWSCRIVPDLAGLPRVARIERGASSHGTGG
jgi:release factor glutamine methyltransferase